MAELEPLTITPYKPDVYVLYSKIGHLRVELESFTAANIPNGFNLAQLGTNYFKYYYLQVMLNGQVDFANYTNIDETAQWDYLNKHLQSLSEPDYYLVLNGD